MPPPRSAARPLAADLAAGDLAGFIRAQTRLAAPPLIPEITLWLSRDEPTVLWERLERASGGADLPPPFWAYPWAGGIALARYLLDHPGQAAGRTVLDLASGSGLVAIAAGRLGAAEVTASDIDPVAVAAMQLNAAANGVALTVAAGDLLAADSGPGPVGTAGPASPVSSAGPVSTAGPVSPADLAAPFGPADLAGPAGPADLAGSAARSSPAGPGGCSRPADLVLAGDVFYERRMAHRALGFLRRARDAGARVLIGDPGRAYLPPGLRAVASFAVPAWAGLEDTEIKQTTVWELP